jgi:hypothetical protein
VARSGSAPGGWGAEESEAPTEPGHEATDSSFAIQLGLCLAEFRLDYDSPNERVIPTVQNAAVTRPCVI